MTLKNICSLLAMCCLTIGGTAQTSDPTEIKSANKIQGDYVMQPVPTTQTSSSNSLKPLFDYPEHWIVQIPESFPQKGLDYSRLVKEWITQNPEKWAKMVEEYTARLDELKTDKDQKQQTSSGNNQPEKIFIPKEKFDSYPTERQQFILSNPDRFSVQH
jgi:hypothetical protein